MEIKGYSKAYNQQVINLILHIQQVEFGVPVTITDQPDLLDVENFYCRNHGHFWIATENEKLIGTIALIDTGNGQSALRKMFVDKEYRGKEKGVGQQLLDHVIDWCREKGIREIYLGTVEQLQAAQKFYLRNGFVPVEKTALPESFPRMPIDNLFFMRTIK